MPLQAVYPGSFDPITNGHYAILRRAVNLFDKVIIAVIDNPSKKPYFSRQERVQLIQDCLEDDLRSKVEVKHFSGLLVDFVKKEKAKVIVRGLRALADFEYEFAMALTNRKLAADIETIFIMTDYKYSFLHSDNIRQVAVLGGDVSEMVPANVADQLKKHFKKK